MMGWFTPDAVLLLIGTVVIGLLLLLILQLHKIYTEIHVLNISNRSVSKIDKATSPEEENVGTELSNVKQEHSLHAEEPMFRETEPANEIFTENALESSQSQHKSASMNYWSPICSHSEASDSSLREEWREIEDSLSSSEGDSTQVQSFSLPDPLRRLRASSTSTDENDASHIKIEYSKPALTKHQKKKKKKQGNKSDLGSSPAIDIISTPGWLEIQGPLANYDSMTIYLKIEKELNMYSSEFGRSGVFNYLSQKLASSNKDDMALMTAIQGYYAAHYITGDSKKALKQCKEIIPKVNAYNLRNPFIIFSNVCYNLFIYYMRKGKPGKAYAAIQKAVSCIQNHAPSSWTALVYRIQGDMYNRLAQVRPNHRSKYQQISAQCYTSARDHYSYQGCEQEENYLYYPVFFTLDMVHVALDMPTIHTIRDFRDSDIVYQRLSECNLSHSDVIKAQDMLKCASAKAASLTASCKLGIDEISLICELVINIRLSQLEFGVKNYLLSMEYLEMAFGLYKAWFDFAQEYKSTKFVTYPNIPKDVKKTMEHIRDSINIRLHNFSSPTFQLHLDSTNSLNSDSDVLPSRLISVSPKNMK